MSDKKLISNVPLIKDLIQGDESVAKREDFNNIDIQDLYKTLSIITDNPNLSEKEKVYFLLNSWKLVFTQKPPEIEEFLTQEWLGATALDLYPHVRDIIINFMNPENPYRYLYLSTGIGFGKSTITAIVLTFIFTHIALMRNPKKYFNIAKITPIACALGSFTLTQASRVLAKPFKEVLKSSPAFRNVKFEDRIEKVREEELKAGTNRIVWTSASSIGSLIQMQNDLHIMSVSDSTSMLGVSILSGAMSELSFFVKHGYSPDDVNAMTSELKGRIFNRFSTNYYARMIVDSSPLSWENKLEKEIFSGQMEKDPLNYVIKGIKHWELEAFLHKYPIWTKTKKTFKIFTGSAGKPTKEITDIEECKNYLPDEIVDVPIDLYEMYKDNPTKIVQDYLGIPSQSEDKLISDYRLIENMFDSRIRNIIDGIIVPSSKQPENLIWDMIKDKFFIKTGNTYEFYRNPKEFRWLAVDQSLSGDTTGIAMIHPEIDKYGEVVIIFDFTITIVPSKEQINLDAIIEFILDLKHIGNLHIKQVNFDQFQSANGIQKLNRAEITTVRESVDSTKAPYLTLISMMKRGKVKGGRNIFLKNNLKSIIEIPYQRKEGTKIDHSKGKTSNTYNNDWDTSICGINAKDTSDPLASSLYSCINMIDNYVPIYKYIENITGEKLITNILEDLRVKQGLIIKK